MRDYAECSVIAKRLRFLADDLENAYGAEEGESLFADAADAIEELLAKNNELWIQLHVEGRSLISEPPKEVE